MKRWFIVHTRPKWEKKVQDSLTAKGFECFCPLNKVHRQWSDRVKVLYEPLFKNLIFVKIVAADKAAVRTTPGVLNFFYKERKLISIKEKQMQSLKTFLVTNEEVQLINSDELPYISTKLSGLPTKKLNGSGRSVQLDIHDTTYLILSSHKEQPKLNYQIL